MSEPKANLAEAGRVKRGGGLLAIAFAIGLTVWFSSRGESDSAAPTSPALLARSQGTVSLSIEFGDQRDRRFTAIPWRDGDTVQQIMERAQRIEPAFRYQQLGEGESAFVAEIDGQPNEGAGAEARNWFFYVNSKRATQSIAVEPVADGDRVEWKLERFNESPPGE